MSHSAPPIDVAIVKSAARATLALWVASVTSVRSVTSVLSVTLVTLFTPVTAATVTATSASDQESLSAARDLYAGAKYEDALVLLDRLRTEGPPTGEARAIEQYRVFCLLALGRAADADRAIEAIVRAEPLYQPSTVDVSPRVRTAFREVRKRILPSIAQQRYLAAKSAFDRQEWVEARNGFRQLLDVLGDPEIALEASQPQLADLRTLASSFYDLSVTAAAPPPPPPPPPPTPIEPRSAPVPMVPVRSRVYSVGDAGVVPPVAMRQALPPFPASNDIGPSQGNLEVVIDEHGAVESAVMRSPLSDVYDRQVIAAARRWQFKPATLGGVPVKFRKTIQISLKR